MRLSLTRCVILGLVGGLMAGGVAAQSEEVHPVVKLIADVGARRASGDLPSCDTYKTDLLEFRAEAATNAFYPVVSYGVYPASENVKLAEVSVGILGKSKVLLYAYNYPIDKGGHKGDIWHRKFQADRTFVVTLFGRLVNAGLYGCIKTVRFK